MADDEILITIRLTPGRQGYGMMVSSEPKDLFPDTLIDACERAARFFAQKVQAAHTAKAVEDARLATEQARRILHG